MRRQWIIWYAIGMHLLWALMLAIEPRTVTSINISHLGQWLPRWAMVILFAGVAVLSVYGLLTFHKRSTRSIILLLPQQFLLLMSAGYVIEGIINKGGAVEGLPVGLLIFSFGPTVIAAILHNVAILEGHVWMHIQSH